MQRFDLDEETSREVVNLKVQYKWSDKKIGEHFGVPEKAVKRARQEQGIDGLTDGGKRNYRQLAHKEAEEIRRLKLDEGWSDQDLARFYNIPRHRLESFRAQHNIPRAPRTAWKNKRGQKQVGWKDEHPTQIISDEEMDRLYAGRKYDDVRLKR